MLNPDNNIKCVELQASAKLGLDDVVVTYEGGELDKSMREAGIPHSVERVVDFCIQDYE